MKSGDRLNQIETLIAQMGKRLDEMDERLDKITGLLGGIVEKLEEAAEKLDQRTDRTVVKMDTNSEIKRRLIENEKSRQELKSISNFLKNKN
ncbi:hypothetical protein [Dyadobacter sp. CY356]|uniref:hypothetical protein n=1 Tax=Dyadobacter sp. CY356 TaxID=2906442 RepID=UPI001F2227FA|nr:hypothetical protein [Dyadobacter sp. CY356]MCF0054295.1 hypothetical protein [Dyadobacter sp. CY356]